DQRIEILAAVRHLKRIALLDRAGQRTGRACERKPGGGDQHDRKAHDRDHPRSRSAEAAGAEKPPVGGRNEQPAKHQPRLGGGLRSMPVGSASPPLSSRIISAPGVALISPTSCVATTTVVPRRLSAVNR